MCKILLEIDSPILSDDFNFNYKPCSGQLHFFNNDDIVVPKQDSFLTTFEIAEKLNPAQ